MKNKISRVIAMMFVIAIMTACGQAQSTKENDGNYMWKIYVTEGDLVTEYIAADYKTQSIGGIVRVGDGKIHIYNHIGEHIGTVGGGSATVRIERVSLEDVLGGER